MIFKLLISFTLITTSSLEVNADSIEDFCSLRVDSKVYFKSEMNEINKLSKKLIASLRWRLLEILK